jgi:hypothetical protein
MLSSTRSFAPFSGSWTTHSGRLVIGPSGQGRIIFRTYQNCTATIVTACDKFRGNFIYDGGFVTFTLKRVVANRATGEVNNSSFSWAVFTTITVILHRARDTVNVRNVIGFPVPFCGPTASPGTCGA